ncbi:MULTISPECIES: sensor domain-containing diguanylate cyclase [unclassified Nocardia]|uniref:sensor domain-containing diguanylate cyclase n=1 Tax=unclassified Nocardia TaxID=2637762 RepID=UPI001CE44957|nr:MULTISPECIES: sensor domain-containing diguanylate cyclase [unclassified Nocardia]
MDDGARARLARAWWQELAEVSYLPMPARSARRLLAGLVSDFAAALAAEPFDADAGAPIGAALVEAQLTGAPVLTTSARVLAELAGPDAVRFAELLAAFGRGYGEALQQRRFRGRDAVELAMDQARRAAEERFRVVFDNAAVAIAVGGVDGTVIDANRGLADMVGVPVDCLRGRSVYDFAHPDDRDEIRKLVYEKLIPAGEGTVNMELRTVRPDGGHGWVAFAVTFVRGIGRHDDYLLAVGVDSTEQHRMQDELHRQARNDPLTGLPNRRHLLERIELLRTGNGAERLGLCFIDLDGFKGINDRFGHGVGDRLLAAVAQRLCESASPQGVLVARIGGDEFAALIPPPADDDRVAGVAEAMLAALARPVPVGNKLLRVTASIGAVTAKAAGTSAESLFDAADTGLYRAKADGKSRWVLHHMSDI